MPSHAQKPKPAPKPSAKTAAPVVAKSAPQKALEKMGLRRDIDLALHLPLRYEDETRISQLSEARDGETVQIEATVADCQVQYRPKRQLVAVVDDGTDTCTLRFFNFYPSQQKALAVGARLRIRGEVRTGFMGCAMLHPSFKTAGGELPTALTPVYPTAAGLPQAYLRKAVASALSRADLNEHFLSETWQGPAWKLREALSFLHHPTASVQLATLEDRSHPAWQRLKADELLAQQLSQLQAKQARDALRAPALRVQRSGLQEQLLKGLPFALTHAQQRVAQEIAQDLEREQPMHRLLQGDVGSGKTVLAALAAAQCVQAGYQCALMVPTEILATQHFQKLVAWLEPLGVRTAWLVGSQGTRARRDMLAQIASGEAGLVVGTHAAIQDKVQFHKLALAIVDEQHRFGVAQRLALREKMQSPGMQPHLLMMSATPIPRTLAMSYYADLDVSTLDELPPGRTPVVTKLVSEARRDEVVQRIHTQIEQGRQVYWVCPLIEESEALDLANATATHEALQAALAPARVALLHSRMKPKDKQTIMQDFVQGRTQVLVSTTVIEVGVDVPNASLMVIEHAERFGLSQLHQLRGRVGRGAAASACILLYGSGDSGRLGDGAKARLKAMVETNDGFEIARRDLDIRGPGEFLGARQSGAQLLRFADLATDTALLAWAREFAQELLEKNPEAAQKQIERWLGARLDYLKA
jgi:ATP-dependent DNA helicase RecG